MGSGGDLYATSYTMPDKAEFGTGPPSVSMQVDCRYDFMSGDQDSYQRAVGAAIFGNLRQLAANDWSNQWKIDHDADRVRSWGKPARVQMITPAMVEPAVTPTNVPDGGTSVLLLGGALCGLAVLRWSTRV